MIYEELLDEDFVNTLKWLGPRLELATVRDNQTRRLTWRCPHYMDPDITGLEFVYELHVRATEMNRKTYVLITSYISTLGMYLVI